MTMTGLKGLIQMISQMCHIRHGIGDQRRQLYYSQLALWKNWSHLARLSLSSGINPSHSQSCQPVILAGRLFHRKEYELERVMSNERMILALALYDF